MVLLMPVLGFINFYHVFTVGWSILLLARRLAILRLAKPQAT